MPEKKRQHFVPQFYLRFFTTDAKKETISLFHIASQRLISNVSIDRQAYKDYFYGADKVVESGFELLEGRSAEVLKDMISKNAHPNYYSKEHHVILSFTIMLHARTLYSAEEQEESIEKLVKQIFSKDPRIKYHLDEVKIGLKNPTHWVIQNAASMIPLVSDLGYKLLINRTKTPFITSDHPVVFYNQFFEKRRTWGSNTGLVSKGLQIFFPLSPKHYIIFYDKEMYKVGGFFHRPVSIKDSDNVNNLNGLQYLNSHKALYFNNDFTDVDARSLITNFSKFKRAIMSNVEEYQAERNSKGQQESLIHSFKEDVRSELSLSFVSPTKVARRFKMDNRSVYVRNETMTRIYDEFMSLVPKGVYKPSEFQKFFMDKYGPKK
jgi:hypothetical protein